MMLTTSIGAFPIPDDVAVRLPEVPDVPDPDAATSRQIAAFRDWLDEAPEHRIAYERLRRWQVVQDGLARKAREAGSPFTVSSDGLE